MVYIELKNPVTPEQMENGVLYFMQWGKGFTKDQALGIGRFGPGYQTKGG